MNSTSSNVRVKAAKAIAIRKYKQRIKRRDFMLSVAFVVFFATVNLALAAWAWPKIIALRKKHRDRFDVSILAAGRKVI